MWICKPTGLNQGRGIFLLQSQEDISAFRLKLQSNEESQCNRKIPVRVPQARIVQRWVDSRLQNATLQHTENYLHIDVITGQLT